VLWCKELRGSTTKERGKNENDGIAGEQNMTRAEWIELAAIGAVAAGSWVALSNSPATMQLWQIVLGLSGLLLAQSLARDVAILVRRGRARANEPRREAQCFCLESTVGARGVLAGAGLAGVGSSAQVMFHRWEFCLAIAATMALGFLVKDLVISWNPIGVRREKDHLNLIVRWKRKAD
jgi:hypothetical protein